MSQSRQLAAIMFTDIVGYTALMGEDEQRAFELLKKNRSVQRPIIEKHNGRWLKEIGDGVLASFNSVSEAVYCAKEIQKACENEPDLKLRIGIHEGEVVFEGDDVFGDGVNIASRLEPLAPVGGILVSESVHNNLINKKDVETIFVGEKQLKNVKKPVKLYQVLLTGAETIPVETDAIKTAKSSKRGLAKSKKLLFAGTTLSLIIIISYFLIPNVNWIRSQFVPEVDGINGTIDAEKLAVAVMPFRNDSDDPQNLYFCNGLMEDVINQLSQVEGLRVPSITSMLYYREHPKTYDEIVAELNVTHLLEGSVRKLEDRALMTVSLIDATRNDQVWSDRFEIDLTVQGVWEVQFDIAKQIKKSLQLALSPNISQEPIPTESYEAYNYYLQAHDRLRSWDPEENNMAIDLLRKAISIDTTFYIGYAELAIALCQSTDMKEGFEYESANVYAQKALQLMPGNVQALEAMAYYTVLNGDPRGALEYLDLASKSKIPMVYNSRGWCHFQLGNYEENIYYSFQALRNDPNNPIYYIDLSDGAEALGLFEESISSCRRAIEINPEFIFGYDGILSTEYHRGNFSEALLYGAANNILNKDGAIQKVLIYFKQGNLQKAKYFLLNKLESYNGPPGGVQNKRAYYRFTSALGHLMILEGDSVNGQSLLLKNIEEIKSNFPDTYPAKFVLLAECYGSLGMVDDCLVNLRKGLSGVMHYYSIYHNPLMDPIRYEVQFQRLLKELKAKNDESRKQILSKKYFEQLDLDGPET